MPIACDPNATIEVWLKCDADMPRESRPVFVFRPPTGRKAILWNAMIREPVDDTTYDRLYGELREHLAGWKRMPDPGRPGQFVAFDRARLEDVTTTAEAWELLGRLVGGVEMDDRKKSGLPSPTSSGEFAAGDAPPAAATA